MIKVLVVDDSALMRRNLKALLERDPDISVVGTARDGEDGLAKYAQLRPDVVTMDVNMPRMDGLSTVQHLVHEDPKARILMVSSLTAEGATTTLEAIALGALDYVLKPGGTVTTNMTSVEAELIGKVKAIAGARRARAARVTARPIARATGAIRCVVIGVSTGGPRTMLEIVPHLPANLAAPVLVVQHMPANFTGSFAQRLDGASPLAFKEAGPGDVLAPGCGYLAPGGKHMVVAAGPDGSHRLRITPSPAGTLFRPSVDVTLASAIETFGAATLGVILTGMGSDGAEAMVRLHRLGGPTIAEHQSSAIVYGMPREVVERGAAEHVLPVSQIGPAIAKLVGVRP